MKRLTFLTLILLILGWCGPGHLARADRVLSPNVSETVSDTSAPDPATELFDLGVRIGRVEQGALQGADPGTLVPHLVQIREQLAGSGGLVSLEEIDALIDAMEHAKESRDMHERIVAFRKTLTARLAGAEAPGKPEIQNVPFDCDQGSWEGVWKTTWGDMTLVFREDGSFHGTYGPSQHAVSGNFDPENPKVLRGRWDHFGSTSAGGIRFEMKAPNRFEGGWSSEIPVDGAGSGWSGTRRRTHHSEILIVPVGEATIASTEETWSQPFLVKKGFSVHGRNADFPFVRIHTLSPETGEWEKSRSGNWEDLAGLDEIRAGSTFTIEVILTEALARRQIAIEFGREAVVDDEERFITLRTRPLRMVPPKPKGTLESDEEFPPETIDPPDGGEEAPSEGEAASDTIDAP